MPDFESHPDPLADPNDEFDCYNKDEFRNQLLFRLLARHGTIVASSLEFNATDRILVEVTGTKDQVPLYGGLDVKLNTPQHRLLLHAPYLRNPYQNPNDDVVLKRTNTWVSAQPLLFGKSASEAQALLSLDNDRISRGPFAQEPFEGVYEPFKNPAFRYFAKSRSRCQQLLKLVPLHEQSTGMLGRETQKLLCTQEDVPKELVADLNNLLLIQKTSRTILGHLLEFATRPEAHPEWKSYLGSEVRKLHHQHKSHTRLHAQNLKLLARVGQANKHHTQPLTEARGEYIASKVMAMVFAGERFELKMGYGDKKVSQGIDQIWAKRHPKTNAIEAYFVIECKGSKSAKTGQNKEETQMSPGWIFKKLLELAHSDTEDPRLNQLAMTLLSAMFDEKNAVAVFGMTIKALFDSSHETETSTRFNLQISKQFRFPEVLKLANEQSLELKSSEQLFKAPSVFKPTDASSFSLLSTVSDTTVPSKVSKSVRFDAVDTKVSAKGSNTNATISFIDALHPEHPRNTLLMKHLTAHVTSILSVHDYFGIDPKTVTISGDGKLKQYTGFAATIYGNGKHTHQQLQNLVDPYHKDDSFASALLLETQDRNAAKKVIQWKRENLRDPKTLLSSSNRHEHKALVRMQGHYRSLENSLKENQSDTVVTEVSGEFLGARAMAVIFGEDQLELKMGHGEKAGSHGIDQIWARRDKKSGKVVAYFIVECKGSKGAHLGQNIRETQMSPAWVFKTLLELAQNPGRLRSLSDKVLRAMFTPSSSVSVYGVIIQSLFDGKNPRNRFNIRITSRLFFPELLDEANTQYKEGNKEPEPLRLKHDRMPLSKFLPDYKGSELPPLKPSPMLGKKVSPKTLGSMARHLHHDYPLSEEQVGCLNRLGRRPLYVAPDGDCAYNSVISLLKSMPKLRAKLGFTTTPGVKDLKARVVQEINDSQDFAKRFLENGETLESLKKNVEKPRAFFGSHGDIALPALGRQLGLRIIIIHPNGVQEDLASAFHPELPAQAPRIFLVLTTHLGEPNGLPHYYPTMPLPKPVNTATPSTSSRNNTMDLSTDDPPVSKQGTKRPGAHASSSGGSYGNTSGGSRKDPKDKTPLKKQKGDHKV